MKKLFGWTLSKDVVVARPDLDFENDVVLSMVQALLGAIVDEIVRISVRTSHIDASAHIFILATEKTELLEELVDDIELTWMQHSIAEFESTQPSLLETTSPTGKAAKCGRCSSEPRKQLSPVTTSTSTEAVMPRKANVTGCFA